MSRSIPWRLFWRAPRIWIACAARVSGTVDIPAMIRDVRGLFYPRGSPFRGIGRPYALASHLLYTAGMTRHLARGVRWFVFTILMILAIIGLALPVVPQIPFFIGALI